MRHALFSLLNAALLTGCLVEEWNRPDDTNFPMAPHLLYPEYFPENGQISAGVVTGKSRALEQPIPFSHNIHAEMLQIDCQYCHSEARNSPHGGVPPLQMCMNCHAYVKTDNPDVLKIHAHYCAEPPCKIQEDAFGPVPPAEARPIEWNKVHDLPDYVRFHHGRHVQAGVQCTECHGQVQLQGQKVPVEVTVHDDQGHTKKETVQQVTHVMVRETTLQMGWCLDCHASHPSIDQNYGEAADLRRAELKDCWTCHK